MAFSLTTLAAELDKVVSEAVTFADMADKWVDVAAGFAKDIPVVGPDVQTAVTLVDEVDKALNALKGFLDGLA